MELIYFSSFFFLLHFFCGKGAFTVVVVVVVICSIVQNFLSIRDYLFKENMLINDENCPYQISNFKVQCSVEDVSRVLQLETGNL